MATTWKETDLLADLATRFKKIGDPVVLETDGKKISWMQVNVFDAGVDENDIPLGNRKNVEFYVLDRGEATEEAYYAQQAPAAPIKKAEQVILEAKLLEPVESVEGK